MSKLPTTEERGEELEIANRRLKKDFNSTILVFSTLVEFRDKDVKDHPKNVADLVVNVAQKAGLDNELVQPIKTVAVSHDVGKTGISDAVLLKDVMTMTEKERDEYMLHSVRGQAAIDFLEELREVGIVIRHHHECYNDSGFPEKLKKDEIPLGARIIAMADFIDRTVKRLQVANALETALQRCHEQLGTSFDPVLFSFFREVAVDTSTLPASYVKKRGLVERELEPRELQKGMVGMRDVFGGTGLLLIGKGTCLDEIAIKGLKRYSKIDPPTEPLLVLTQL